MLDKRKYKKDSYMEKRTQMPVTEGVAATDKG